MQGRSLGLAVFVAVTAACSPALDWRELRPDDSGGLTVLFPCKPASHARLLTLAGTPARTTMHACTAAGATWAVAVADVQDPARVTAALVELKAAATSNLAAGEPRPLDGVVPGATPNPQAGRVALAGRYPDGRAAQMQVTVFTRGTIVIQATVLGERLDSDAVDTFHSSLRLPQ